MNQLPTATTSDEIEETAVKDELEMDQIDDPLHDNEAGPSSAPAAPISTKSEPPPKPELLSEYSCPICFSPPTNATMTPCGHVCCGACLFMAVKSSLKRGGMNGEPAVARCPVCRALIPNWDGKGGGVIGLKVRVLVDIES